MSLDSTAEIRRAFLEYFKGKGHTELPSSSLVPQNDPTLQFTNAGMNQFKDVFTGKDKRDYNRATTAQKCVRAGGKHNDLENVGQTPRHHTFFEMMGNFSFGDYFKEDAIAMAWDLCIKQWNLPLDRIAVTVFEGADGIPADDEAAELWKKVGVPEARIFKLGKADNYWQMGDTGPQGPCSEIHFLMDPSREVVREDVAESNGWMEIWNLVFMQFMRETSDGPLNPLPKPSVDTGAGLERLAVVLQGKQSNYETDAFTGLLANIAERAGRPYKNSDAAEDVSMRVIADHARATAFLVGDGVQPSNEGRGYVLRRIMRRAIRHGRSLGFDDLFFARSCTDVVEQMKGPYPELERAASLITKVADNEETAFRRTLDKGLRLLSKEIKRSAESSLAPEFVADLYDTYGFPIDLTRIIAAESGRHVDEDAAQEAVKTRQAGSGQGLSSSTQAIGETWFKLRDELGTTKFLGFTGDNGKVTVTALLQNGERVDSVSGSDEVILLADATPFYGESGGQVGDVGIIDFSQGKLRVTSTTKPLPELIAHHGTLESGSIKLGDEGLGRVDATLRNQTKRNHSATHLLHLALREILGDHVQQKGSLVAPDRLRFDYAHFEPLTSEQATAVENRVAAMILANTETEASLRTLEEAKSEGAMMLFGEKYGDEVRVVRIGGESVELCGGTHVARSGDIGSFKIISDSAIAAGVRRLEAVTGLAALHVAQRQETLLKEASATLKTSVDELPARIAKLIEKNRQLERDLEAARTKAALGGGSKEEEIEEIGGIKVWFKRADGTPKKALRPLADQLRDKLKSGVVVLTAADGDRAALLVASTKDLQSKVNAGQIVKEVTQLMGGSGGGRADFAQGGGPVDKLEAGLGKAREIIADL